MKVKNGAKCLEEKVNLLIKNGIISTILSSFPKVVVGDDTLRATFFGRGGICLILTTQGVDDKTSSA